MTTHNPLLKEFAKHPLQYDTLRTSKVARGAAVVEIAGRTIGPGHPSYVIAEAGSNHNRKLDQAYQLIDIAVEAGADAVKFQTYHGKTMYSKFTPMASYLKQDRLAKNGETLQDLLTRIEIPWEWHQPLVDYCRKKGITFLSTPFDLEAVDQLEAVGVPAYKIASFEITDPFLLEKVAKTGKPIILSTGMADLTDIERALRVIYGTGNTQVVLLHCVISYPPRFEYLNLRAIQTLQQAFQIPVGFSDHTLGDTAPVAATALGACAIEKHYTISRSLSGPDHPFAVEPEELKAMITAIHDTEQALGSGVKCHSDTEQEMYLLGRRSLIAAASIPKGTVITREMVTTKRPGFGIDPFLWEFVIGRRAGLDIEEDAVLTLDILE